MIMKIFLEYISASFAENLFERETRNLCNFSSEDIVRGVQVR